MNHLSLFNGIGGFQLAAHWAGFKNVAHVEIDDWCNKVVAKHFPDSECFTDIKEFTKELYEKRTNEPSAATIDVVSGGFP